MDGSLRLVILDLYVSECINIGGYSVVAKTGVTLNLKSCTLPLCSFENVMCTLSICLTLDEFRSTYLKKTFSNTSKTCDQFRNQTVRLMVLL